MNKTQLDKTLGTIKNYVDGNYLAKSGGTMTGNITFTGVTSTTYPAKSKMITWSGSTDGADIYYQVDASDKGRLVLNTRDDADCIIMFANNGTSKSTIDNSGNFSGKAATAGTADTSKACSGNAATATKLATARTITLTGDTTGSVSFDGSANVSFETKTRQVAFVGSDTDGTAGWYKVAEQTCSGYGDTNITFMVTSTYANYNFGILQLQIRSDDSSIACKSLGWIARKGLDKSHYIVVISGMKWTLYAYQPNPRYGRLAFEILSQSNISGKSMSWALNFANNGTKESTAPTASVTSSDVATVNSANSLTTARTLTIGSKGKTFNGSANVSWTLDEIGAAPKSHTHKSLELSGNNTISLTNDTTTNWGAQKNSIHYYSTTGKLTDQPGQYGILCNFTNGDKEVHQLWLTQSNGNILHRGGNAEGWNTVSWLTLLDSANYQNYAFPKAGGTLTGKITFAEQLGGGGLSSLINCNALHSGTGNGQLLTTHENHIYVGNPKTPITIEGNTHPKVNVNGTEYTMYHTGNKPTPADIGAATSGHVHYRVDSLGNVTAETGANHPSTAGLSMRHVYNNGYPVSYGNVLTMRGAGSNQILTEWSGSDGGAGRLYIRNKRDTSGDWSSWAQVYTSTHKPSVSDIGALSSSGGNVSGSIAFTTNNTGISGKCGGGTDGWFICGGGSDDNGYLEIGTSDNSNEPIYVRQYNTSGAVVRTAALLDGSGNSTFPGQLYGYGGVYATGGNAVYSYSADSSKYCRIGVGGSDCFLHNSKSGKYLQLKDDGTLAYSDAVISLNGHSHGLLHSDLGITLANTSTDSGWSMINGSYNGFILRSIRTQQYAPSWHMGNYAAGICFGGADTKGVMSCSYDHGEVRFAGGNGSKPVWWFGLQGTSGTTYNLASFNAAKWGGYSIVAAAGKTSGTANTITFTW